MYDILKMDKNCEVKKNLKIYSYCFGFKGY